MDVIVEGITTEPNNVGNNPSPLFIENILSLSNTHRQLNPSHSLSHTGPYVHNHYECSWHNTSLACIVACHWH